MPADRKHRSGPPPRLPLTRSLTETLALHNLKNQVIHGHSMEIKPDTGRYHTTLQQDTPEIQQAMPGQQLTVRQDYLDSSTDTLRNRTARYP